MNPKLRRTTIKYTRTALQALVDANVICRKEQEYIYDSLSYLENKGEFPPPIPVKLITKEAAADMLGISLSQFKTMESDGLFPFRRRMVGAAVRYRNIDIINYCMDTEA